MHRTDSNGFTMVELIVVVALIPLIIVSFIAALYTITFEGKRQSVQLSLEEDSRSAITSLEQDIRIGTAFAGSLPASFSDPYGPNNSGAAWSFAGSGASSRVLILVGIATSTNSQSASRTPVYSDGPTYNCTTEESLNPVLNYVTIYFVRNNTLYRRILTDTTTPRCTPSIAQKQSCPGELSGSWNALCQARDEVRARNVTSFAIDYYTERDTSPTDIYGDPTADNFALLDDAKITLTLSASNPTQSATSSLRIARLNQS